VRFFRRVRRYTEFAMLLHWLVAAGIAFLYVHGFDMMRLQGAEHLGQLNLHRSVGILVFALVLVRIWWRITHPPPLVHILIYVLLVVNGIAGSVGWIASGDPVVLFGVQLAPERTPSPALNHLCIQVGLTTVRILAVVIALHVLAVVKHEWLDRDRLLERMEPGPPILLPLRPRDIAQRIREWRSRRRELPASSDNTRAP